MTYIPITPVADGDKGDITIASSGNSLTIDTGAVTYAKMQTMIASSLIGNPTGGVLGPQAISIGATLYVSGTTLDRAALIGHVTAPAASNTTTIASGVVTAAMTTITGTPNGSKFLRDDWSWQTPAGGPGGDTSIARTLLLMGG
jgi:hypothetical protein